MGNTESNTRQPNYKIFKITHVENNKNNGYFKVYLHDYVTYLDGKYKHVYLEKDWPDYVFDLNYKEGNYLEIDLNAISCEMSGHDFSKGCGPIKRVEKDHVIEKRDSNGDFKGFFWDTVRFLGETAENEERYQASIVDARMSNYTNLRQTSYDMPPKW